MESWKRERKRKRNSKGEKKKRDGGKKVYFDI